MTEHDDVGAEMVGELLALIAHDLRNPLSALSSNLGFLASVSGTSDRDVAEAIQDSLISCDGLSHLIDNIDLFGQELRAKDSYAIGPLSIGPLITSTVTRCTQVAASHGLQLKLEPSVSKIDEEVNSNGDMLSRCLSNLIRNSLQHAPAGSLVRVSASAGSTVVQITVRDSGIDLPGDLERSAFTAAGQLSAKAHHTGRYSRGLGLYAAKIAASAAGARIAVRSDDSSRNIFTLSVERVRET